MPPKYHIHTANVPDRFQRVRRSGVIAWEEGCLRCTRCVKKDCVYDVYATRRLDAREMMDTLDNVCQDCFRCVQNCPNRLIHKALSARYTAMGDEYWTPEIISTLWNQAETGRIPVSGAGYTGPFIGPGFDNMWTDMSEIVRPTRDGIHGREYISTAISLGRKHMALEFDAHGELPSSIYPMVQIPVPLILDLPRNSPPKKHIIGALLQVARELGTFAIIPQSEWAASLTLHTEHTMLYLDIGLESLDEQVLLDLLVVELPDKPGVMDQRNRLKELKPEVVVVIRVPVNSDAPERARELVEAGVEVLHFKANEFGREQTPDSPFIKDRMKEIHLHLVNAGVRDEVSILGGGGVAMAEHMAKLIICGADAVTVDMPLLIAMECRVCRRCSQGLSCPVELGKVDSGWGGARMRNLMGAWHSQLIEVLGAMGMREVARLRGEMGRAMFFEDLDKEYFPMLGRKNDD
ncbi:glutamate synthase-related protein [Candidatus Hydrogenedentota bacterium]